jgi:hypothetical protein
MRYARVAQVEEVDERMILENVVGAVGQDAQHECHYDDPILK